VLVQPKRQSHSVELLEALRQIRGQPIPLQSKVQQSDFSSRREPTGTGTVPALVPTITFVVWRDKIPATVGAIPTILGTDANPPASTTLMLSRLGSASVTYNSVAVRNPVTDLDYHIYDVRHFELNPENYDYVTPASAYGLPAPKFLDLSLSMIFTVFKQIYATYARLIQM